MSMTVYGFPEAAASSMYSDERIEGSADCRKEKKE